MSRILHLTEGLILSGRPVAEADKFYFILTKELGLVRAVARGVRNTKSKLRFSLNDFSAGFFTLARGREIWHLAGAEAREKFSANHPTSFAFAKRVGDFLRRFVPLEEIDQEIYGDVRISFFLAEKYQEKISALEIFLFFRLLARLGYIKTDLPIADFINQDISIESLDKFSLHKREAVKLINQAINGSHL